MKRLAILMALALLALPCTALAEEQSMAEQALSGQTLPAEAAQPLPDGAVQPEAQAPAEGELSGCFGQPIEQAAQALGGLSYTAGEEYRDNYEGDGFALRGNGKVELIDLKAGGCALCGVTVGMKRDRALALLQDFNRMWDYEEEVAFNVVPDAGNPAASQILVVFFEDGVVSGAWYRAAGE